MEAGTRAIMNRLIRNTMFVLAGLGLLGIIPPASAQTSSCDQQQQHFFTDPPIPGAYLCIPEGPDISVCFVKTDQCETKDGCSTGCCHGGGSGGGGNGGGGPVPGPPPKSACS